MYTPLNYEQINAIEGTYKPSMVKLRNNKTFDFWQRALFQRVCSVLDFKFPDDWSGKTKDFILWTLFRNGFGVVANDNKFGLFFQPCALSGYNFYYQPTKAIVSNPLLQKEYTIGTDCELIKLTPDYMGVWDIITYYAEKLALLDNAINMSLINSKFAWIVGAKNKGAAQALKKMMDKVNQGEPMVVYDQRILDDQTTKSEPFQFLDFGNVKEHYLTTDQLMDFNTLLRNFDTEIGIPTVPYEKKERMVTAEADSRQLESVARATVWLDTIKSSMDEVNKLFGTSLDVKFRFINNGGDTDGNSNNELASASEMA